MSSEIEQFLKRVAELQREQARRELQAEPAAAPDRDSRASQPTPGRRAPIQRGRHQPPHSQPPHSQPPHSQPPHSQPPHSQSPRDIASPTRSSAAGPAAARGSARQRTAVAEPIHDPPIPATYPVDERGGQPRSADRRRSNSPTPSEAPPPNAGTVDELIRLLRQPQGLRQAVLLREILDRPLHRW